MVSIFFLSYYGTYGSSISTSDMCFGYKDTIMGGNNSAITTFSTLDVDSSNNIAVGGSSNDTSIVNSASQTAFVVLINAEGGFTWTTLFDSIYIDVKAIAFKRDDYSAIAIALTKTNDSTANQIFSVMASNNGSILYSLDLGSPAVVNP